MDRDSGVREGIDLLIGRIIVAAGEHLARENRAKALQLLEVLVLAQSVRDELGSGAR